MQPRHPFEAIGFWRTINSTALRRIGKITMTQTQIIQTLADSCEVTKKVAKHLLDTLAHTAVTEVKKNGLFVIPGIGRLVRLDRKARTIENKPEGTQRAQSRAQS